MMEKKSQHIPAIRFVDFTDSWQEHQLGEISNRVIEKNTNLTEHETFTNSAELGIISQEDFFDHEITNEANVGGYYVIHPNDFIYNPRISATAPVGPINRNKLGRNGVMSPLYTVFRPHDVDNTFLEYYFKTNRWHSFMQFNGDSGARSDRFSIKTDLFYEMPIAMPKQAEQQKIGALLQTLDKRIDAGGRKLKKLKEVKVAMLAKMFPKKGQRVPEIRFAGFTEDWEQHKLGDLGKTRSGVGFPEEEQGGKEGIPFYKVSDMGNAGNEHEMVIANNYVTDNQITRQGWKPIIEVPAIFFAKVGAAVLLNRKRLCRVPFLLDNNTMAYSMDTNLIDANFTKMLFETIDLTSLVQIGALPSYNAGDVESIEICIPTMDEQKKIGDYFKKIDHIISAHKRKLQKLQNVKQALLGQMFCN